MFVVYDSNKELITFTRDEKKALRLAMKFSGIYKNIRRG